MRRVGTNKNDSTAGEYMELAIPYYFSSMARERAEDVQIGDYVTVRGLTGRKYELMDVFPHSGSVRVRRIGDGDEMSIPWNAVTPWRRKIIRSATMLRALGDWLFGGKRVYLLSEPDRVLKQKEIHWDRQTCDLEDEDGRVYRDVPWDQIEFWDEQDCHLPDDA